MIGIMYQSLVAVSTANLVLLVRLRVQIPVLLVNSNKSVGGEVGPRKLMRSYFALKFQGWTLVNVYGVC